MNENNSEIDLLPLNIIKSDDSINNSDDNTNNSDDNINNSDDNINNSDDNTIKLDDSITLLSFNTNKIDNNTNSSDNNINNSKTIIIGADGYLGSYLSFKLKGSYKVYSNTYHSFLIKYNQNKFNHFNIYICGDQKNNSKIINDFINCSNNNNTFIFFSSASIYNSNKYTYFNFEDNIKYKESDFCVEITNIDNETKQNNTYQKLLINNEKNINKLKGIIIIIRLGTLFGIAPKLNATRGINRMIYSSIINNELIVSHPDVKKSYTALSDLYNFITIIQTNKNISGIYNISSFDTTIGEITKLISDKYEIPIINKQDNNYIYSFHLNIELANSKGWYPQITIDNMYNELINDIDNIQLIKYTDDNYMDTTHKSDTSTKFYNFLKKEVPKSPDTKVNGDLQLCTEIIIYKSINKCRVCNSTDLIPILDLNNHPPPNRLNDKMWEFINFKLVLNCCIKCWHSQLNGVVNPCIMYNNYPYLSGTSETMNKYFESFVNYVINYKSIFKNVFSKYKVLDIGCNDGALLDKFKKKGYTTYGIDPTDNLISKKHNYYCGFFNNKAVEYFNTKFDIITAFNVFAHVDDIYDFLSNLELISHDNTHIFIQTSQCNMITNNEFDTIYHEHLSFFNLNSILKMCEKSNFYLLDCEIVSVHGSSYLFCLKKKTVDTENLINLNVIKQYQKEMYLKYFNIYTYFNYNKNIMIWKNNLLNMLLSNKYRIIGVGASAKGITILNFLNDDFKNCNIKVECLIDENPLKIGKTITSIDMEIKTFDYVKNKKKILFILFAWNFKKELIDKINKLNVTNSIILNLFPLETESI